MFDFDFGTSEVSSSSNADGLLLLFASGLGIVVFIIVILYGVITHESLEDFKEAKENRYTITGFCIDKDRELPETWGKREDATIE